MANWVAVKMAQASAARCRTNGIFSPVKKVPGLAGVFISRASDAALWFN